MWAFLCTFAANSAMAYTPEQIAMIRKKEACLSPAHRRDPLTQYTEGYFHVTLNVRDGAPILGYVGGRLGEPTDSPDAPQMFLSELGRKVEECWHRCREIYPSAELLAHQVMPEHFHGLLHLKAGGKVHLGQMVRGFMIGCTHGYWDTLGIDWRSMNQEKGDKAPGGGDRTPEYNDRLHTRSLRGPALFVRGYNDVEALTPEAVEVKRAYIRSNPERRLMKGQLPSIFAIHQQQHSKNWTPEAVRRGLCHDRFLAQHPADCEQALREVSQRLARCTDGQLALAYIGCRDILLAPRKVSLICHRADASHFGQQKEAVLKAAREGAVVVSAFISPRERDIMKQLLAELLPVIEIVDNGIPQRYKPHGAAFYACAERRLLQMSCWDYAYQRDTRVTRPMCMTMNELVRIITTTSDDWWKTAN